VLCRGVLVQAAGPEPETLSPVVGGELSWAERLVLARDQIPRRRLRAPFGKHAPEVACQPLGGGDRESSCHMNLAGMLRNIRETREILTSEPIPNE
jgi:hypothetical protein